MTDLPAKSAPPPSREARRVSASIGGALGALLWLECIAFGLPNILFGSPGYSVLPIAALAGALVGLTRAQRLLLPTAAALAIVLAFVAYTPALRRPAHALVRSDALGARAVHAVVVLSGGITTDGHLGPPAVDRMLTALSLIRRGVASTLVMSRERRGPAEHAVTSDADQQRLVALLERPVRLLIVDSVFSTRDEAVRVRALARSLDITSIAVVTSPTHTRRACATFERVGFVVTCVPSESREVALTTLRVAGDRVRALQLWLYELVALARYRASGWI